MLAPRRDSAKQAQLAGPRRVALDHGDAGLPGIDSGQEMDVRVLDTAGGGF